MTEETNAKTDCKAAQRKAEAHERGDEPAVPATPDSPPTTPTPDLAGGPGEPPDRR